MYIKNLRHDFSNIATLHVNNKELLTPSDKANALNDHFVSVFTRENSDIPKLSMNQYPILQDIIFSTIGIKCILEKWNPSKSAGPDDIPSRLLKLCAAEVSPFLQFIFTQSLNEGTLPRDWLKANITPIHKKGDHSVPANYRPISLTSVCCKIMEHIIFHSCMSHLESHPRHVITHPVSQTGKLPNIISHNVLNPTSRMK